MKLLANGAVTACIERDGLPALDSEWITGNTGVEHREDGIDASNGASLTTTTLVKRFVNAVPLLALRSPLCAADE